MANERNGLVEVTLKKDLPSLSKCIEYVVDWYSPVAVGMASQCYFPPIRRSQIL